LSIRDLRGKGAAPGTAGGGREFEADGTIDLRDERPRVSFRCPELQFGVARGADANDQVRMILADPEPIDDLRVAAIQAFSQAKQGSEDAHHATALPVQRRKARVRLPRRRLTMIPGDQGNDRDLVALEAAQATVGDEVVRVLVVAFVADVRADVV
jgi:hypothetical protein